MRGKEVCDKLRLVYLGITPAYAGKSVNRFSASRQFEDHPRVCGEKRNLFVKAQSKKGSPPRMRGKEVCDKLRLVYLGITPAYAGKSLRSLSD